MTGRMTAGPVVLLVVAMLAVSCDDGSPSPAGTARLLFAGDVMLGRDVAPVASADGSGVFEDVRFVVSSADLAVANLESPLTDRGHVSENPYELEADPATASLLAAAGFDLMAVANNHAGDAGPAGVLDTLAALHGAGLAAVGAGAARDEAVTAVVREANGVGVAFLAFDLSGGGLSATAASAGVAAYEGEAARAAVQGAAGRAGVVVVSLHGGIEYLDADPVLERAAADLVRAGADVVWGHGAHVVHPVAVTATPAGNPAVVATGLGNLLFDQEVPSTRTGMVLEVLVSADGVLAYRTGRTDHADLRAHFEGWDLPAGDAVLLEGEWWTPVALPGRIDQPAPTAVEGFTMGDVIVAGLGDVTGDGRRDLVVSYRRPYDANPVNRMFPGGSLTDATGRSAHLGVFDPATMRPRWAAGTLLRPVAGVVVCDGDVALAFDGLDDPAITATGALTWAGFGFTTAPELPGPGSASCYDVDGDGGTDPVITGRNGG